MLPQKRGKEGGAAEEGAAKAAPSDEELAAEIRAIVAGVNLEEFSRKDLLKRLGEQPAGTLHSCATCPWDTRALLSWLGTRPMQATAQQHPCAAWSGNCAIVRAQRPSSGCR